MVHDNNENNEENIENTDIELEENDIELEEVELKEADKLKLLRKKLEQCEEDKKTHLDELQRAKAEFLNARKRLEEEKITDRMRAKISHVEQLLPLCDSFQMAMSNKEVWEKADEFWRKGIEGIYSQLSKIIESYGVNIINPIGEAFDPHRHEAIGTEPVDTEDKQDIVQSVVQSGYEMKVGERTELIRPARVTTGIFEN